MHIVRLIFVLIEWLYTYIKYYIFIGVFWPAENIGNFDVVIDISGVAEFYVNTYDVSKYVFFFSVFVFITKTYLYNFDPWGSTGVYRGIHYFSYFCSKT